MNIRQKLSTEECDRLVAKHTPLVSAIARSLLRKLPASVEIDDLMQDGFIGLLIAIIQATANSAGRSYDAYLTQRIRGAMIDGLRKNDPGSRKLRHEMRKVEVTINRLCHQLGHMPSESAVATALDMSLQDYQALLQEADGYTLLSLDDFNETEAERDFIEWCAATNSNPLAALERKSLQRALLLALNELNEREEQMMILYYRDNLTMREIGVQMSVSEGRISQIHTQAIAKLRAAVLGDGEEGQPSLLKPRWRLA